MPGLAHLPGDMKGLPRGTLPGAAHFLAFARVVVVLPGRCNLQCDATCPALQPVAAPGAG
jgi:hypothetical protein